MTTPATNPNCAAPSSGESLTFAPSLLAQLAFISDLARRCREIDRELGVARSALPELALEAKRLAEQISALPPSRLVAFPDAVRDLFMARRRNELITGALRASQAGYQTFLAKRSADLQRAISEFVSALPPECSSETRRALRSCIVPGEPWHSNAARLLAFCRAHGAHIEEAKS